MVLKVALANTQHDAFEYLPSPSIKNDTNIIGARITVPLRNKQVIGILVDTTAHAQIAVEKLKHATEIIDQDPVITPLIMKLCRWASNYYHCSLGDVLAAALPRLLRQGRAATVTQENYLQLTKTGKATDPQAIKRAPKQQALLAYLQKHPGKITKTALTAMSFSQASIQGLCSKGWLAENKVDAIQVPINSSLQAPLLLNEEQKVAVTMISAALDNYACFLLDGVTGSGKTEVYFQCIQQIIEAQQQVLILVPEIGLTPQLLHRLQQRFAIPIVSFHSGLTDRQRLDAWVLAKSGRAKIIVGTRSAVFTPISKLAMIIVDEEHDVSFKQQDGFRYSGRDLAIVRAQMEKIPIVLGSATPSLESLHNTRNKRYHLLKLPQRTSSAAKTLYQIIDVRSQRLNAGISNQLLHKIREHLAQDNQVLLFINRRGYAPLVMCHHCAWIANCKHCDAKMTHHTSNNSLLCHHCLYQQTVPAQCPNCQHSPITLLGVGTERLEQSLQQLFPEQTILRIDRDSTQHKNAFAKSLKKIHEGKAKILVGTQMLTKGHHFPNLTLVGIIDADSGFFSSDFRASERLGQMLLQVAGRAGREHKAGEAIIQTHIPDHPLLTQLISQGYHAFANTLLHERKTAKLPPFYPLAILRSAATDYNKALKFLDDIKHIISSLKNNSCRAYGPAPAPMAKKANYHHAQLLIRADNRTALKNLLATLRDQLPARFGKGIKWSIDVDPVDTY